MGHTGVSQFKAIARLATARQASIVPHATIGIGIFLAASLHASVALRGVTMHEYQHSVFDHNLRYVDTTMRCEAGYYRVPSGPGHGVTPKAEVMQSIQRASSSAGTEQEER